MAMQRRLKVQHGDMFPHGAYLRGGVEPVADFDAAQRSDGTRPQAKDKDTGQPVWSCQVIDADLEAGRKDATVTVKIAADHQPVPPANKSGLPFTPVEFVGLTATPYVDDNGPRPRLAWSLRAAGFRSASASVKDPASEAKAA
ncbi:MAG: plasmid replication, integration and excision activator [Micrococcales bacterium]|nr:plasmid replication, integration and excision activator [Micrococcales bacterium]